MGFSMLYDPIACYSSRHPCAIAAASVDMAGTRKRFSLAETVRLLRDSDAKSFKDDIDRDSNNEPSDSKSIERDEEHQD